MCSSHEHDPEVPLRNTIRRGDRYEVTFDMPGARAIIVSAAALAGLGESDLYALCLEALAHNLALVRLELARPGEPGAFCVRWKEE